MFDFFSGKKVRIAKPWKVNSTKVGSVIANLYRGQKRQKYSLSKSWKQLFIGPDVRKSKMVISLLAEWRQ